MQHIHCVGWNMPRLQQLRGRIRRVGEGVSSIWTISCQVRLLSVPEHATLETLHFPLMKIRRIKFGGGGKHFSTKELIWLKCLQRGLDSLANMKVCENKNSSYKLVQASYKKMCTEVPSVGQTVCTHPRYIITAFLSCLHFKKKSA